MVNIIHRSLPERSGRPELCPARLLHPTALIDCHNQLKSWSLCAAIPTIRRVIVNRHEIAHAPNGIWR